jgi:hypothetical protein
MIEQPRLFAAPPWWLPPLVTIAHTKAEAIKNHNEIIDRLAPENMRAYADGSGIDGKIGSAAHCSTPTGCLNKGTHLGSDMYSTVYAGEVHGVILARGVAKERRAQSRIYIFTDNQAALQAIQNPRAGPCQHSLAIIVDWIDELRETGAPIEFHWICAH